METVILMSAYKADFHREKAVRTSAELLRDSGIAFFPLDIRRLLKNSFSHQIKLIPYKELGEISLKEKRGWNHRSPNAEQGRLLYARPGCAD